MKLQSALAYPTAVKKNPHDPQQTKHTFEKPLNWKYPVVAPSVAPVVVPFELRYPVPAATVAVECKEKVAHVEVKKDMFGIGQLINPADLFLGNCAPVAEDPVAKVLIFEVALQDCQSTLTMKEDSLIYSFTVNYVPHPLGIAPVVRTTQAAVIVECHYPRKKNVSSLALDPLWIPFSAVMVADEFLYFTLKLMMDDWQNERPSYQYFLGDIINIQATVKQFFHVPLRVYVDSCVATLSTDVTSTPSYAFIDNFGCLVDARITGSVSKFMPRVADNKLQFQLEAFRFQGVASGMLYITCHLKATSANNGIDATHRACSYINSWKEASGVDAACGSCESGSFGPPSGVVLPAFPPGGGVHAGGGSTGYGGGGSTQYGGGSTQYGSGSTGAGSGSTGAGSGSTGYGGGGGSTGYGGGGGSTGYGGGGGSTGYGGGKPHYGGSSPGYGSGSTGYGGGGGSTDAGSSGSTGVGGGSSTGAGGSKNIRWRNIRDVSQRQIFEWEGHVTLGPIPIGEKVVT
ncbi:zona pellucida sperm-binding protein 3-like isoform X2 [Sander vitreus]